MKTLKIKNLLFLGLFVSTLTFANGEIETIKENEPGITKINFKELKLGSILSIKDINGMVLYKEPIIKPGDYSKGFDLTALPNGDYYFELDTELEIVIIPFNVVSNQVAFKKEEKSTIFKPVIRVKDDMVFVSQVNFDKSPIEYKIYYAENHDLVLSEEFDGQTTLKRIYDFSKAEKGRYLFVFNSNGRKFTKSVKI